MGRGQGRPVWRGVAGRRRRRGRRARARVPAAPPKSPAGGADLPPRLRAYVVAMADANDAAAAGQPFDLLAALSAATATAASAGPDPAAAGVRMLWDILRRQAAAAAAAGASGDAPACALLAGARAHLEAGFAAHAEAAVASNRAVAALGGAPSRAGLVRAYLRVTEGPTSGPLDFDSPGGADTAWQRLFVSLRAGFGDEAAADAAALAAGAPAGGLGVLPEALAAWRAGAPPPPAAAAGLAAECDRALRGADRTAWAAPAFRARAGVLALLAGDARAVAAAARDGAALMPTIEDFLWFHAGAVRAPGGEGAGGGDPYTLASLQAHVARFPPAHYSAGGRDPLLYAAVCLLSAQPRAAVAFLARHPGARSARGDAPHVAAAAAAARLLASGGPGDAGAGAGPGADPAPLLRAYGRSLARAEARAAAEYYAAAARFGGSSLPLRAALLRELLVESGAAGTLLAGAGGEGGPLARFARGPADRAALLRAVAAECEATGAADWALDLYGAAGAPADALRVVCGRFGDVLERAAAGDARAGADADRLARAGADAVAALRESAAPDGGGAALFAQLVAARGLLTAAAAGDAAAVLRCLAAIPAIPQDAHRVKRCVDGLASLPEPLAERLSALLPAAGEAAAAAGDAGRVRALAAFAADAPQRVSRAAFERLNALHDGLMG